VDVGGTYRVASVSFLRQSWEAAGASVEDTGTVAVDAVLGVLSALPACSGSPLPCVKGASGALQDGRISWN
jgi:hypothetical protein